MSDDSPLAMLRTGLLLPPLILALAGPVEGKSIGKDQVNIREQPNLSSSILFTAPIAYPIEVTKESGDWVQFKDWLDNNGWVYKPLVSEIDTAVITVDNANIRSTPSVKGSIVATAKLGEIYTILSRDSNWVKLGYYETGNTAGWIRDDLIFGE